MRHTYPVIERAAAYLYLVREVRCVNLKYSLRSERKRLCLH